MILHINSDERPTRCSDNGRCIIEIKDCALQTRQRRKDKAKEAENRAREAVRRRVGPPSGYALGVSRVIKYKVNSFVELSGK